MNAVKNAPTAVSSVYSSHSSPDNARPPAQIGFKQIHNSNELKHSRKRRAKPHNQSIHIHIAAAGEIRGKTPPLPLKISCHDPIIYFDGSKMTGWFCCCLKNIVGTVQCGAGRFEPSSEIFRHFHLASQGCGCGFAQAEQGRGEGLPDG